MLDASRKHIKMIFLRKMHIWFENIFPVLNWLPDLVEPLEHAITPSGSFLTSGTSYVYFFSILYPSNLLHCIGFYKENMQK